MNRIVSNEVKRPTWEEIHRQWKYICTDLFSPIINDIGIVDIPVKSCSSSRDTASVIIDWWPTSEVEKWGSQIQAGADAIVGYKLSKGTQHTMELLYELRNNPEGLAAVWIGASLKDKIDDFPETWRGVMSRVVQHIFHEALKKLDKLNACRWHHAMRNALPIDLFRGWTYPIGEDYKPSSFESLMSWVALESVMVRTTWTIVRIFDKDKVARFIR